MAYQRYVGYQYETSPRKIKPEYDPYEPPKRKNKNNNTTKKVIETVEDKKKEKMRIKQKQKQRKLAINIAFAFAILLAICYRNSLINESFNKKEGLKKELSSIQKETQQLKVNIQNSLNLNNIEQEAKAQLGMQKLENKQKIYITLPKKDHVETSAEQIIKDEELTWWQKLIEGFTK